METIGILLMAYGGPNSLADVEPYLLDVRGGRETSPELVEEIRQRYAAIGGRSPLLDITIRQAEALAAELNRRYGAGSGDEALVSGGMTEMAFQGFVGMRHWQPRIADGVRAMREAGIQRAVAIVMAPHYSEMSTGKYMDQLQKAAAEVGGLEIDTILSWHDQPGLVEAIMAQARKALARFDTQPFVLFTAHSLPKRIVDQGDPYPDQLEETATLVAGGLDLPENRWKFCYQSAGRTVEPWLDPQIDQVIPMLAQAGHTDLLIVPVGFVADHVEVLFDIDIEAKELARRNGIRLERSPSLNDSPDFIAALADIVAERLELV